MLLEEYTGKEAGVRDRVRGVGPGWGQKGGPQMRHR